MFTRKLSLSRRFLPTTVSRFPFAFSLSSYRFTATTGGSSASGASASSASSASSGVKKYDLFGYEVDTNTKPWIQKIKACKYYDDAGGILVEMNVRNCPPDIETYNAALEKIYEAEEKHAPFSADTAAVASASASAASASIGGKKGSAGGAATHAGDPKKGESKFCAMMDLLEEMNHRNKIKPNYDSWVWVMKTCVADGNYRLGYVITRVIEQEFKDKKVPKELFEANEANAKKAAAEGKEHPGHLSTQLGLFDIKVEG